MNQCLGYGYGAPVYGGYGLGYARPAVYGGAYGYAPYGRVYYG